MRYFGSFFVALWLRPKVSNPRSSYLFHDNNKATFGITDNAKKSRVHLMSSSDFQSIEPFQELYMSFDKETFEDSSLQMAVEIFAEAQAMAREGNHQQACEEFQSGLFIGRKIVQKLQESDDGSLEDDPRLALEWLIASYLSMFRSRVALGDWNKARADAWAACNYAQYGPNGSLGGDGMDSQSFQLELASLSAMWTVCQNTNDKINEWQTLQSLQQLLKLPFPEKVCSNLFRQQVEERIKVLRDELETK